MKTTGTYTFKNIRTALLEMTTGWADVIVRETKYAHSPNELIIEIVNKEKAAISTLDYENSLSHANEKIAFIQDLYFRVIDKGDEKCKILTGKRLLCNGNLYLPIDNEYSLYYGDVMHLVDCIVKSKSCEDIYSYLNSLPTVNKHKNKSSKATK